MTTRWPVFLLLWLACSALCSLPVDFKAESKDSRDLSFIEGNQKGFEDSENLRSLSSATTAESFEQRERASPLSSKSSPISRIASPKENVAGESKFADDENAEMDGFIFERFEEFEEHLTQMQVMPKPDVSDLESAGFWKMEQDELDAEEEFMRLRFDDFWVYLEEAGDKPLPRDLIYRFSLDWPLEGEQEPRVRKLSDTAVRLRVLCFSAMVDENFGKLKRLIRYGVDISKPVMASEGTYYGSFLHFALRKAPTSSLKLIQVLLSERSGINQIDGDGESALFIAIRNAPWPSIKKLLKSGASLSVHSRISHNATALSYAAYYERFDVMKKLLKKNRVDVNEVDTRGRHVLDLVLFRHNIEAFRLILNCPELILCVPLIFYIFKKISGQYYLSFLELFCKFLMDFFGKDLGALFKIFLGLIERGLMNAVKQFLILGLDVNFTFANEKGIRMDVVGFAALYNQVSILMLFKEFGFPLTRPVDKKPPFVLTIVRRSIHAFGFLAKLESTKNIHSILRLLCRLDRAEFVDVLMQHRRADVDSFLGDNEDGILQVACRLEAVKLVQLLVEKYDFVVPNDIIPIVEGETLRSFLSSKLR